MVDQLVRGGRLAFLRSKFGISVPDLVGIHYLRPWNSCLLVLLSPTSNHVNRLKMSNLTKKGWPDKGWSLRARHLVFGSPRVWTFANPNILTKLLYGRGKVPKNCGRLWSFLVLWVLIYSTFWVLLIMHVIYVFCRLLHVDHGKSKKMPIFEIAHFLVFFNLNVNSLTKHGLIPVWIKHV